MPNPKYNKSNKLTLKHKKLLSHKAEGVLKGPDIFRVALIKP